MGRGSLDAQGDRGGARGLTAGAGPGFDKLGPGGLEWRIITTGIALAEQPIA